MTWIAGAVEVAGALCVGGPAGWLLGRGLAAGAVSPRAGLFLLAVTVAGVALGGYGAAWLGSLAAAHP